MPRCKVCDGENIQHNSQRESYCSFRCRAIDQYPLYFLGSVVLFIFALIYFIVTASSVDLNYPQNLLFSVLIAGIIVSIPAMIGMWGYQQAMDETHKKDENKRSHYRRFPEFRKTEVPDRKDYLMKQKKFVQLAKKRKFIQQWKAPDLVTAVDTCLKHISDWLNKDSSKIEEEGSVKELILLDKQLEEKKKQLSTIIFLMKYESSIEAKLQKEITFDLLDVVEKRIIKVKHLLEKSNITRAESKKGTEKERSKIGESKNKPIEDWIENDKELIKKIFSIIRNYGSAIDINVLREKLAPIRPSMIELCDFLERVEKETNIWSFNGRYIELEAADYLLKEFDDIIYKCQICKMPIIDEKEDSKCPECFNHFHYAHLAEWVKMKGNCPVCKKSIRVK